MWAVGVLTYELLMGSAPFTGQSDRDTYRNITNLDLQAANDLYHQKVSATAKDFIARILVCDPKHRVSLADMLSHPWLSNNSVE